MAQIRPVSDLRNKFKDIAEEVHQSPEGVILTKNGYGHMVVMSYDAYRRRHFEDKVIKKLIEAGIEAKTTDVRYDAETSIAKARKHLDMKRAANAVGEQSDV